MDCWHCERPAKGVCHFCGRGLCKEHTQTMPDVREIYKNNQNKLMAIVIDNVLYCGACKPKGEPIEMTLLNE